MFLLRMGKNTVFEFFESASQKIKPLYKLNCTNEKNKIDYYLEVSRCISFPISVETILYHLFNENEMTKEIVKFLI